MSKVLIASLLAILSCSFCTIRDNPDLNIINFPMGKPEDNQNCESNWEASLKVGKSVAAIALLVKLANSNLPFYIPEVAGFLILCWGDLYGLKNEWSYNKLCLSLM